jgi:hypothetical protein
LLTDTVAAVVEEADADAMVIGCVAVLVKTLAVVAVAPDVTNPFPVSATLELLAPLTPLFPVIVVAETVGAVTMRVPVALPLSSAMVTV